jgi:hypothetical protein
MTQTAAEYCGRWTAAELERSRVVKIRRSEALEWDLIKVREEIAMVEQEIARREERTK